MLACLYECSGEAIAITLLSALPMAALAKCLSFSRRFYVMGKVLSGKLSCLQIGHVLN